MSTLPAPDRLTLLMHRLTLSGYFGLLLFLPIWHMIWYPSELGDSRVITLFWILPLVFPLRGLLQGKAYTHAWSGFVATIYVCHALACYITHPQEWLAASIELLLATVFLLAATLFAKRRGEQLGLELPRNKEKEAD